MAKLASSSAIAHELNCVCLQFRSNKAHATIFIEISPFPVSFHCSFLPSTIQGNECRRKNSAAFHYLSIEFLFYSMNNWFIYIYFSPSRTRSWACQIWSNCSLGKYIITSGERHTSGETTHYGIFTSIPREACK